METQLQDSTLQRPVIANQKPQLVWLQVFRGLAATVVVLHHVTGNTDFYFHKTLFSGVFLAGWFGVDFFFVLSGFIITYIHYKDLGNSSSISSYLKKRFSRIYPIYWVAAAITIVSFLHNDVFYLIKSTLLIPQEKAPYVRVAWSLVYEVGFYLLFGLYIVLGKKGALIISIVHIILIIATQTFQIRFTNPYLVLYSNGFNIEFIFGCLTALLYLKGKEPRYPVVLITIGLASFSALWYLALVNPLFDKFSFLSRITFGLTFATLTYAGAILGQKGSGHLFAFMKKLGDASYSIYLFHIILIAAFCKIYIKTKLEASLGNLTIFGMVAFCTCITAGLVIHQFIEKPLTNAVNKYLKR